MVIGLLDLQEHSNLLGNGPHAAHQFTGNGHHDVVGVFPSCHEVSVAFAEPGLGLPTDVLDDLGLVFESQLQVSTDLRGIAVGPGAFNQSTSGLGVPGFGNGPLLAPLTRGIF